MTTKENQKWPFIKKEGEYFVIGAKESDLRNQMYLSKPEMKRLIQKVKDIDVDTFWWKEVV